MALQTLPGFSLLQAPLAQAAGGGWGFTNLGPIDATGEKVGWAGRVWFPARTGTKDISRIGFRFGSVTKAGGSGLTLSLQDVDLTTGQLQPDGTQDQTVAIANGDATFAANTWHRSGALSANRTVNFGDLLAVVVEYDGSGRLGADSVNLSYMTAAQWVNTLGSCGLLFTASWATSEVNPNVILEMSDGTFGTLLGGFPLSAANTHTYASNTAGSDELANAFEVAVPCKTDGAWFVGQASTNAANLDVVLYEGTTARRTTSVDANAIRAVGANRQLWVPWSSEYELAVGTTYYLAVKPTTTTSIMVFSGDVSDNGHLVCGYGDSDMVYTARVDGGAWDAPTTTRRLACGLTFSAFDDGAGGGGGGVIGGPNKRGGRQL